MVPRVNHISAENLVFSAAGKMHAVTQSTYTVVAGRDSAPVDHLSTSSSSSSSSEEDLEQYDKEPGIRQPSRSCSEDLDIDLEEYNEEPVPRKQEPEDTSSPKVSLKLPDKKSGKKGPRLEVGGGSRSRTFADHLQNSPGLSEDVWKEAMAGVPLASSESFDTHILTRKKDKSASWDDDDDDDGNAFERRARRKDKSGRSVNQISDLKWTSDLPVNDSLSRETLDDISCDSYVPPEPSAGWDVDSLEVDLDDYIEDGGVKVLDVLARTSDTGQDRVVGRRKERVDKEQHRKKTLSTSFETNIDDIEFDTELNTGKVEGTASNKEQDPLEGTGEEAVDQNKSNIKPKEPQSRKGKARDVRKVKESTEETGAKKKERQPKQPAQEKMEPEKEEVSKGKGKKPREPASTRKTSATIPIMAADVAVSSLPFEEDDEDLYSNEPMQDLSGNINLRMWQGPTTNIDDEDDDDLLFDDQDQLPSSNLHDQRLDEDSISVDEKLRPVKPPVARSPYRVPQSSSSKAEIIDRLPDRPRRSRDPQSSRHRQPLPRTIAARQPYNGISTLL